MTCWTIRGFKPGTKSHKTLNFNLWRGRIYLICVLLLLFISGSISRIWHVGPSVVLNRALKVGMIRTRVSPASWGITTAGWWNQCFVQSRHQSVATSLYEGRVEGGTRCSKIFTARTDSIFSQLNGREGARWGGLWHVTRVGPLPKPVTADHHHQNPIRPVNQSLSVATAYTPFPLSLLLHLSINLRFSGGLLWYISGVLVCLITERHRYRLFDCLSSCKCPK